MASDHSHQEFIEFRLNEDVLDRYDLPDIPYPVPANLHQELSQTAELPLDLLLYGLQVRSSTVGKDWQQFEGALDRLIGLLTPTATQETVEAFAENWWLELGPVDLDGKFVTVQREDHLLAAIAPREDGRLRVATFRPLDAKSLRSLMALGDRPGPGGDVQMRENNWEYALDSSAGMRHAYAAERGESYLSYWEKGIGINWDGTENPAWRACTGLTPRPPRSLATELEVYQQQSTEPRRAPSDAEVWTSAVYPKSDIPLWPRKRQQKKTLRGRFLGCLLGGAVGDALGAPVEFMTRREILARFGRKGITTHASAFGGLGTITDDTQMTLFTAEGLLRGWVRWCFKGLTSYPDVTAHAYLRWLQTQGVRPTCDIAFGTGETGWLFQQQALHHRRAPGNTCLSALQSMKMLSESAQNNSKGCGGVMRMAPVGLFAWHPKYEPSPLEAFRLGCDLAALTHGHPTGQLPAGVLAVLILALTDGAPLSDALVTAKACLRSEPGHEETLQAIELAEALAGSGVAHHEAIKRLGEGWIAEEALAIAIYCAQVARSFKTGVILAVNHDGDSDSTGAITGNLLGALHGVRGIPEDWLEKLELRAVITELAEDLYARRDWEIGDFSANAEMNDRIWRKYPGF